MGSGQLRIHLHLHLDNDLRSSIKKCRRKTRKTIGNVTCTLVQSLEIFREVQITKLFMRTFIGFCSEIPIHFDTSRAKDLKWNSFFIHSCNHSPIAFPDFYFFLLYRSISDVEEKSSMPWATALYSLRFSTNVKAKWFVVINEQFIILLF